MKAAMVEALMTAESFDAANQSARRLKTTMRDGDWDTALVNKMRQALDNTQVQDGFTARPYVESVLKMWDHKVADEASRSGGTYAVNRQHQVTINEEVGITDEAIAGPIGGQAWWMNSGDTWVPLEDLPSMFCDGSTITAVDNTTFISCAADIWILHLDR
jgi:hypothetical protein